jgi:hypothetical protein
MNRRILLKSLASLPALSGVSLPAQTPPTTENFKVETVAPDVAAQSATRFLKQNQFAALARLGEEIAPSYKERPGSKEAGAVTFLDFLLSKSPSDRQKLYRDGLDALNTKSQALYKKPFAKLTSQEAEPLLTPLKAAWTYRAPADPYAAFLLAAKEDFLRATFNSREFIAAVSSTQRGFNGLGFYWLPIE